MGHRNWSHNHCNQSDTKLSVFTTTRGVLTELYTQVPSPSRTHTHTHPNTPYALSQCAAFFVHLLFRLFAFNSFLNKITTSTCIWLTAFSEPKTDASPAIVEINSEAGDASVKGIMDHWCLVQGTWQSATPWPMCLQFSLLSCHCSVIFWKSTVKFPTGIYSEMCLLLTAVSRTVTQLYTYDTVHDLYVF